MLMDRKRGRAVRGTACAALSAALLMGAGSPASADDSDARLVLSVDGTVWVQDVLTEMFDSGHVWVPGDSSTYTVLFRNDSGEPAHAFADLVLTGPAAELFEARLRMDQAPWAKAPTSPVLDVAAGQVVRLDLELTLASTHETIRTAREGDVSAQVTLRGTDPGTGGGVSDPGAGPGTGGASQGSGPGAGHGGVAGGSSEAAGQLAWTGWSSAGALTLALTALVTGLGIVVSRRSRRRRGEGGHGPLAPGDVTTLR